MALPKVKTLIVIGITALLVGLLSFVASTMSVKKQLASVHQIKEFNFRGINMQLKQVEMDGFNCFLVVYDVPEKWEIPQIHFNCPKN